MCCVCTFAAPGRGHGCGAGAPWKRAGSRPAGDAGRLELTDAGTAMQAVGVAVWGTMVDQGCQNQGPW